MKRLKSIDIFRGFLMLGMIWVHLYDWWLIEKNTWFNEIIRLYLGNLFGTSFVFISGLSTCLWYRNKFHKMEKTESFHSRAIKYEYLIKAALILAIALTYNSFVAITVSAPNWIWSWFMLLTIAISLFIALPLLGTSKIFRILIGIAIWIAGQFLYAFLLPYRDRFSFYGVLYHILFNPLNLDPFMFLFIFFLLGTVVGDIIFEIYHIENQDERRCAFKKKLLYPSLIISSILIISHYLILYPFVLVYRPFSWISLSMGINLISISVLLTIEEFEIFKTKKSYKFLFYFSYYSLTIYLTHNILYFFFLNQLNSTFFWIYVTITCISLEILLRWIYKKWGLKASVKYYIAKISANIVERIEKR